MILQIELLKEIVLIINTFLSVRIISQYNSKTADQPSTRIVRSNRISMSFTGRMNQGMISFATLLYPSGKLVYLLFITISFSILCSHWSKRSSDPVVLNKLTHSQHILRSRIVPVGEHLVLTEDKAAFTSKFIT